MNTIKAWVGFKNCLVLYLENRTAFRIINKILNNTSTALFAYDIDIFVRVGKEVWFSRIPMQIIHTYGQLTFIGSFSFTIANAFVANFNQKSIKWKGQKV